MCLFQCFIRVIVSYHLFKKRVITLIALLPESDFPATYVINHWCLNKELVNKKKHCTYGRTVFSYTKM